LRRAQGGQHKARGMKQGTLPKVEVRAARPPGGRREPSGGSRGVQVRDPGTTGRHTTKASEPGIPGFLRSKCAAVTARNGQDRGITKGVATFQDRRRAFEQQIIV
jgi:hypothetical protein